MNSAEVYDPVVNTWNAVAGLGTARQTHTATLLATGNVLITGGSDSGGFPIASVEIYNPVSNAWSNATSLGTGRRHHTATRLPSGKVLVAAGIGSNYLNTAEVYDPVANSWAPVANTLTNAFSRHSATLMASGKVLVTGGIGAGGSIFNAAELYDPATNQWSSAGTLTAARYLHSATLLPTGEVMLIGGTTTGFTYLASGELIDASAPAWSNGTPAGQGRYQHSATVMLSGKVMLAGGLDATPNFLTSVELYDPAANSWAPTGSLATARRDHTSTLLRNGKILVVGGCSTGNTYPTNAELYDPVTGNWGAAGNLTDGRSQHTATLLPSGKVLVIGGVNTGACGNSTSYLATAEIYDPETNAWTSAASFTIGRNQHTATLLPNGKVLMAGGFGPGLLGAPAWQNQLYDVDANTWTAMAPMGGYRLHHTATLLPNGKVLAAGGFAGGAGTASCEIYDPALNTWAPAASLPAAYNYHTASLLPSGKVLVAGGTGGSVSVAYDTVAVYDPATNTWTPQPPLSDTLFLHTSTMLPDGRLLIAGGTNYVLGGAFTKARLYDVNLGYGVGRRPTVSAIAKPFAVGVTAQLTGTLFGGDSEGSAGTTRDSATDYPLLQLRRIDNEQQAWVRASAGNTRSPTSFASARVAGILSGPVTATVYVNGVPGLASAENLLGYNEVSLDIDRNGSGSTVSASTDGLLVLRYLLGLTGSALTSGAIGATPARGDAVAIKRYLDGLVANTALDIDGNGVVGAATDGLLVLRYLLGFRGAALVANAVAVSPVPTRGTADIERMLADLTQ